MTYPVFNPTAEYFGFGDQGLPANTRYITDSERQTLNKLRSQILHHSTGNQLKHSFYEASQVVKHLEIAVPRVLQDIGVAVGWAGTVVDVLDERIDFLGWQTPDGQLNGLDEIATDNNLYIESNYGHVDAAITGTSFVTVGNEDDSRDRQLITVESSLNATVEWDYRKRRTTAGLSQTTDDGGHVIAETLYLENTTITLQRDNPNAEWEVTERDEHNQGRCFMTRLPNRTRPKQMAGRSEISRSVRYYTDAAVRTMLGMEVNREFYTAPQRFVLNARPEDFGVTEDMSAEQKFRKGLSVAMGMINIVPPTDREEHPPKVQEMRSQPPTPYVEQVRAYSTLLAAECGMPVEYFGFTTSYPPSADSIRQREFRVTKRAERRIGGFVPTWREVALLCFLARDGKADTDFMRSLQPRFADPSPPTRAATADEIQKYVAAKVLVPDSEVTYRRAGISEADMAQLAIDKKRYEAKLLRESMQQASMQAATAAAAQRNSGGDQSGRTDPASGARTPNGQQKPPVTRGGSTQ